MGEAEYLGEVLLNFFLIKQENWPTLRKKQTLEALFLGESMFFSIIFQVFQLILH